MDFDEYEYLEKTVENPDAVKASYENNGKSGDRAERDRNTHSKRRSDEEDRGSDYRSKRVKPYEEAREKSERGDRAHSYRDKDRERFRRGSERDVKDKDRHRGSERDDKDKDRHRGGGDREKTTRDVHRERSDRNGRDGEREKIKERESERERSRQRSRSERQRSAERQHHASRERELREREPRERDTRRHKERKEEAAEPEADPERDQRTVFAYQICLKADERDVYEFFSRAGKVRDVRLIMDRNSRRSKGVGYIEFYDAMSVPMAIALSGQLLLGQPVMVKPSEAEKNLVQSNVATVGGAGGFMGPYSGGARRLYVGNLHFNITEDQLRQVFEPFGPVELVQLPTDPETGQCKGFGFVQFTKLEDARAALNLNGQLEIAGRYIKVSAVTDQVSMQEFGANAADFDDDDGGGISLNARSRALLMQKLDRSGTASSIAGSGASLPLANPASSLPGQTVSGMSTVAQSVAPSIGHVSIPGYTGVPNPTTASPAIVSAGVDPIGVPSECLLLKNMFDPKTETEPDFDLDIKEDVQDECSKFGIVKHIFVDKNSAGHVYLRFDNVNSAMGAQRALHGRWFAGKMITASFMSSTIYEMKFSGSM
eukprot:TRINITY_DN1171_c0_g2_i5.p1 TRINITY_DN1171_c0_g2~~TRINITY_DN1171_c0_g2_i5.p1  ORF type:complete len:600 (+),score=149.55 TRINITY_DN1171_c0_g2_i5:260-2059(+)